MMAFASTACIIWRIGTILAGLGKSLNRAIQSPLPEDDFGMPSVPLDLRSLLSRYAADPAAIRAVMALVAQCIETGDPAAFIARRSAADLKGEADRLLIEHPDPASLPLWGIPFAVKDNIDVAGLPTTAACPAFAYQPTADAFVVAALRKAGAIVIGKTNLDQFATGLNGSRSPHGAPRCVFDAEFVSGGSSSGSAVAVASGMASFALGTDTAGSGRVPAAFNNIIGIKPTNGLLSNTGSVPACKSLDCITIFATSVADGLAVRRVAEGFDASDPYARQIVRLSLPPAPRVGVLRADEKESFGDAASAALYEAAIARAEALGATIVPFDYAPFREIAALLYEGPWVAERLAAIEPFFKDHADAMDPTVRGIIGGAEGHSAADGFNGQYRFMALKRTTDAILAGLDMLLLPTSPTIHRVDAMLADPVRLNGQFGRYTNFANFLGMASAPMACPSASLCWRAAAAMTRLAASLTTCIRRRTAAPGLTAPSSRTRQFRWPRAIASRSRLSAPISPACRSIRN
jgi:allophanate hydrolase